jgi:hypothetical protein
MTVKLITLIQEVYFDIADVIEGNTYRELGYDNRMDFLLAQRDKLARIENFFDTSEDK